MTVPFQDLVCGWSKAHDEAEDAVRQLYHDGYQIKMTRIPPANGRSGIMVLGGENPGELEGTLLGAKVIRRGFQVRELLAAGYCAHLFDQVEEAVR